MKNIDVIVEIPLDSLKTKEMQDIDTTVKGGCLICGKKIKGDKFSHVHLLTNGNIVSTLEDLDNSQGLFPVGPECARKLVIKFAF